MARKRNSRSAASGSYVNGPNTNGPDTRVHAGEAREDRMTGAIEKQTSRMPSVSFLGMACGAIGASWYLKLTGRDAWANFIAQWVPSLLIVGVYNKMVKQHGSDAETSRHEAPWNASHGSRGDEPGFRAEL